MKQKSKLEDKGGGRGGGERGNLPPIKRLNCAPVKLYPAQFNRLQSVRPLLKSDLRWQPADLDSFSAQNPEKKSGNEDKESLTRIEVVDSSGQWAAAAASLIISN